MTQITMGNLNAMVAQINRATGNAQEPWTRDGDKLRANIGNYHLSGAYGGYALHQMLTDGGGIRDVFGSGHVAKRDLYERMRAFVAGIDARTTQPVTA